MAGTVNILYKQGTLLSVILEIKDDNNNAVDITGYTPRSEARISYDSVTGVTLTVAVTDATTGEVTLTITAAVGIILKRKRYVYDIEIVDDATGIEVTRPVEGTITVDPEATKINP